MSLRAEIHEAFDELEPRNLGLEERVIASVGVDRRPQRRWSLQLRAPLSLVAVLLVIAVIAGALMGGRLLADWKRFTAPPVPAVPQTPLQKLESRALNFKHVSSMSACPDGPYGQNGDLGTGPVHMSGSAVSPHTSWGYYFYNSVHADGPVRGPLLVRARELLTGHQVVFIGQYAAGPVIGTDVLDGQTVEQHTEFVIDDVASPYAWLMAAGTQDVSGCEGWQFDGPDLSETVYVGF